jgi:hypothetical protein
MLLIDGVKYKEYIPKNEDEFERVIKEHAQEIFGEKSAYFDLKKKLTTKAGVGSIPDGYALTYDDIPRGYIVEIELARHGFDHVAIQERKLQRVRNNPKSLKEILNFLYENISKNSKLVETIKNNTKSVELHKFLSDVFERSPDLLIIVDKESPEISEAIEEDTHVIEFRTYISEKGESRHVHLFEPLGSATLIDTKMKFLEDIREKFLSDKPTIKVSRVYSGFCYIPIKKDRKIHTEWLYWGEKGLRVELHLERPNDEDLKHFAQFKLKSAELESRIGESLIFDDRWQKNGVRIYTKKKPIEFTDEVKYWAVETMKNFYEVFTPYIDK